MKKVLLISLLVLFVGAMPQHCIGAVAVPALHGNEIIDHMVYLQGLFTYIQFDKEASEQVKSEACKLADALWKLRVRYEQGEQVRHELAYMLITLHKTGIFESKVGQRYHRNIYTAFNQLLNLLLHKH